MRYSNHPQMGHLWRAPHHFPSRQLSYGLGLIIRDNPERSSHEHVEMDRHASSAARFHYSSSWLASAQNSLADAASHFE